MKKKLTYSLLILVMVAAVLAVSCAAPTPTPTPTPTPKPTPTSAPTATPKPSPTPTAMEQLYQLAKKEGEIVWNVGAEPEVFQPVADMFTKKFPGIAVKVLAVLPAEIPARIIMEAGAGKITIDVSRISMTQVIPLSQRNLVVTYDWTGFDIDKSALRMSNQVPVCNEQAWCIFYNTKLLTKEEAPKTWEDLLNPRWKGNKMAILQTCVNFPAIFYKWGDEKATAYIKSLAQQQVVMTARGTVSRDMVGRGEALLGTCSWELTQAGIDQGLPLGFTTISPQSGPVQMYIPFIGAPHPNAAKLLSAFLTTPEATTYLAAHGYGTRTTTILQAKFQKDYGVEVMFEDNPEICDKSEKLRQDIGVLLGFIKAK